MGILKELPVFVIYQEVFIEVLTGKAYTRFFTIMCTRLNMYKEVFEFNVSFNIMLYRIFVLLFDGKYVPKIV